MLAVHILGALGPNHVPLQVMDIIIPSPSACSDKRTASSNIDTHTHTCLTSQTASKLTICWSEMARCSSQIRWEANFQSELGEMLPQYTVPKKRFIRVWPDDFQTSQMTTRPAETLYSTHTWRFLCIPFSTSQMASRPPRCWSQMTRC